ncbi:zincin [Echria macrotheca]|uniref:Mitochondrial intermediate peptidase n=1 Tax=Echria macrotheca TaxID=438768 RepID=A0AAJ0FBG5_9PEZI|nr:zincin [Echria macrotheca]
MLPALRRRRWLCPGCLRTTPPPRQQRWITSASQTETQSHPTTLLIQTPKASTFGSSDGILRDIFDSPQAWKGFKRSGENVGLFANRYLTRPEGFIEFANISLKRARLVVEKVLAASTFEEYRGVVRDLDRLSDILCRVLDMADFVRVTHPDEETQDTAAEAWEMVHTYMNELNTMTALNDQLGRAMDDPDIVATWTEEEKMVAKVLRLDFAKSAVSLPKAARDRFVSLSTEISRVGGIFAKEMEPEEEYVSFPSSQLWGIDPVVARKNSRRGRIYLPTLSPAATSALHTVHDAEARKRIYYASRTASTYTVDALETMLRLRAELASLSGFESYGHLALRDRMLAQTPEAVMDFLQTLAANNAPRVKAETADLLQAKMADLPGSDTLEPWDREYYSSQIRQSMALQAQRHEDSLSSFFSIGTVIQGISRLLTRLYGIQLVPRETLEGETWHPDVRRLDVVSDTDGHLAVLYCDLFYRPDKSPNPAHFTLRCSREISQSEISEVNSQVEGPQFPSPELAATDGMAFSRNGGVVKQLPTIALVCDFQQTSGPALLPFFQVETLFHEMGHAVHSILARTSFQNVSGTRCATDLAELPSTLMEYFASDPAVLATFARHHETDEPLPYELLAEKLREARRFEGMDTENQIIMAMLDQELHSRRALEDDFDSTQVYHGLQRRFGLAPPDPPGTCWQGFFGHLFGYGSSYYSYLFDRALAQRVWGVVFASGRDGAALERRNGERLREGLLKWGGGRDPWRCLADVLGDERLAEGGERAMALVGSWSSSPSP